MIKPTKSFLLVAVMLSCVMALSIPQTSHEADSIPAMLMNPHAQVPNQQYVPPPTTVPAPQPNPQPLPQTNVPQPIPQPNIPQPTIPQPSGITPHVLGPAQPHNPTAPVQPPTPPPVQPTTPPPTQPTPPPVQPTGDSFPAKPYPVKC